MLSRSLSWAPQDGHEGARRHHGQAEGHPIDDHVEKRPDGEPEEPAEADEKAERHDG